MAIFSLNIALLPLTLPLLSPERILPYLDKFGANKSKTEIAHSGPLPQHFSDEFGWPEMVQAVAQVYHSLPPDLRSRTGILAGNYGEAGAIDFFGAQYGLRKSISAQQNYYFWGTREYTGESLILLQWDRGDAAAFCNHVTEGPTLRPRWSMSEEPFTIWLCQGLTEPLPKLWDRLKHWN